jgi:diguanylate cyclase (GGDEF)-like protein
MQASKTANVEGAGKRHLVRPMWAVPLFVLAMLAVGVAVSALYLPDAMRSAAIESALRSNLEVADEMKITRNYYAKNIVSKVTQSGKLTASFKHQDNPNAIPLPATFVKDISDLIKDRATSLSLVSPYPWPHRADRKLDEFELDAWKAFQSNPNIVFSRQEVRDGQRVLRVAVSDVMSSQTCVNCHNGDPQSMRHDWKIGDVRGVMEVVKVVEPHLTAAEERSRQIVFVLAMVAMVVAISLLVVTWLVDRRTYEKEQAHERLRFLAHHDALTGLANRVLLGERLPDALRACKESEQIAVLCLDLDRFKEVNDTLGHATGDALLKAVASRLRGCVRAGDLIFRLGGDEFAILQLGLNDEKSACDLAERIKVVFNAPFEANGHQLTIRASVGIAIAPRDGTEAEELLRNADQAAYQVKRLRRGGWCLFEPKMNCTRDDRRKLEADLGMALENGELELYYQPVVDVTCNEVSGFEALLRWRRHGHELVSPAVFIPVAEDTGMIDQIGEWVIREACKQAAKWPEHLTVAVNLSAVQFRSERLVQVILIALASAGLRPNRLELEITETVLMQEPEKTIHILGQLRNFGIRVALDDFGTGFSSLSYLRTYPFDRLKIDRCFVADLSGSDNAASAIVRAAVELARNLGMTTTAEGVETSEQLERVRAIGCSDVQGYFFGPPAPLPVIKERFLSPPESVSRAA